MHYHCEIIMPRSKDIGGAIKTIMQPFCEHNENPEDYTGNAFWDFYVIGGRWSGAKELCRYSEDKITAFHEASKDKKITVAGFQSGKQEISPAIQIPIVDQLWHEFFPTDNGEIMPCPVFKHSNDQYDSDDLLGCDICLVEEISAKLTCSRVIIAGPSYDENIEATFMLCTEHWNGVNHVPASWDGRVIKAIEIFNKHLNSYKKEWRNKILPKPDWICVTVDYHS